MRNNILKKSPLLCLSFFLMVGILVSDMAMFSLSLLMGLMIVIVLITFLLSKYPLVQSVFILICFLFLGIVLGTRYRIQLDVKYPSGEVSYEAVVISSPMDKRKTVSFDIILVNNQRKLKCYVYKDARSRTIRLGDGLKIQSQIRSNHDWRIGSFSYKRFLEIQGFTGSTFVSSKKWRKTRVSLQGISFVERSRLYFMQLRSRLENRLMIYGMYDDVYGVVTAMVLGDKAGLSKELRDVYSITGASHVLALSGLHLGIIYVLLTLLLGRRTNVLSQLLILSIIWAYVFLVGMPVSVVRSAVMLTVYALLTLGRRDKMSVNTLAFTVMLLLVANPWLLFDIGFQMSFMAVFSILLWMPLSEMILSQKYLMSHRVLKWFWSMIVVSCAAQLGVAPLIAYYFGHFSNYFLLTNFIAIPTVMLILYLSIVVLLLPSLAYLLIYIVEFLNAVLRHIALLPGAVIENLHPSVLQVSMIYVVIGAVWILIVFLRKRA